MTSFGEVANKIIEKSDVILEILDARFIDKTRNKAIERRIKNRNKILVYVINKCDCVEKSYLDQVKKGFENRVFVSATKHLGTNLLIKKIKILAGRKKIKKPIVGVVGYPNVGKSSVINALKGKRSARTSPEAGFTKGQQYVRISRSVLMIDSPGVIGSGRDIEQELVLIGAKNPSSIKDPDLAAIELINSYPGLIEKKYGVEIKKNKDDTIEDIAVRLNMKKKGNLPDTERASRSILQDWLNGKIK